MNVTARPSSSVVRVGADVPVTADNPAQVSPPVVGGRDRLRREGTRADEAVPRRQMRPVRLRPRGVQHVLPAAIAQEAVIATCYEFSPVLEHHPVRVLDRDPLVEHYRPGVLPILPAARGSIDPLSDLELLHGLVASISQ